jgi:hypothetical protein
MENLSQVERFYTVLKENLQKTLGDSFYGHIGRKTTMRIFRECFDGIVEFTLNESDKKVPIMGIGTFEIDTEGSKFKFKPSKRYSKYLENNK